MNSLVDAVLAELARSQFGAVARYQTRAAGLRVDAVDRRVAWGTFREATPRVLVSTAAPDTFEQRAMVAKLDAGPGSAVSVVTAVAYFGLPGFDLEPIHVSRPRRDDRRPSDGVVWHHPRLLPSHHLLVLDNGLTLTTPARALADLFAVPKMHVQRVERAIDTARSSRLTNHALLRKMADEWCERGREGSTALRDYLERKPVDWVPAASNVARRFIQLIVDAGMPEPRSEVNVGDEIAWLGRVDCLDPELPLVAEIDSERFHAAPLDAEADEHRDEGMNRGGFRVERFTESEVWYKPGDVVRRWRDARHEVRQGLAS